MKKVSIKKEMVDSSTADCIEEDLLKTLQQMAAFRWNELILFQQHLTA